MKQRSASWSGIPWRLSLVLAVVVCVLAVERLSAAQGPPTAGLLAVAEQNLDADGNIKIHEQGVVPVTDNEGSLTVDGSVQVTNLPAEGVPASGGESIFLDCPTPTCSGLPESTTLIEFPAGLLLTDLVMQWYGGGCRYWLNLTSGDVMGFRMGDPSDPSEHELQIHLTTGVRVDSLEIRADTIGGFGFKSCDGWLMWSGVVAS